MKILFKIISYLFVVAVACIALLLVMGAIPGGLDVKVVKSGSMEPTIKTGGIIVIQPATSYEVGDIITFGEDTKTQIPTTHRIVGMETNGTSTGFLTKGDANDSPDPRVIEKKEVEGKMLFTVPYLGYILDFARRPIGFVLLVGVPAVILIVDEVRKIVREVRKVRRKKRRDGGGDDFTPPDSSFDKDGAPNVGDVAQSTTMRKAMLPSRAKAFDAMMPGFFLALRERRRRAKLLRERRMILSGLRSFAIVLVAYGAFSGLLLIGGTVSYFSDQELTVGNVLRAGVVDISLLKQLDVPSGARVLAAETSADEAETETLVSLEPLVKPSGTTTFTLGLEGSDTPLPLVYSIDGALNEGTPEICKEVTLHASYNEEEYDGLLTAFSVGELATLGDMTFTVTLPDAGATTWDTVCTGTIVVGAHIAGVSNVIDTLFGDTESFPFLVQGEYVPKLPPIPMLLESTSGDVPPPSDEGTGDTPTVPETPPADEPVDEPTVSDLEVLPTETDAPEPSDAPAPEPEAPSEPTQ